MAYTYKAGADLTGKAGYAVKTSGTNKTVVLATAGSANIGILVDTNKQGLAVVVAEEGERVLAKLGGTVAFGDKLKSDANGALVLAGTAADLIIAEAKQDGVSGDLVYVVVEKAAK